MSDDINEASGDLFDDIGLPRRRLRAQTKVLLDITGIIRRRGITQDEAARAMGITRVELEQLLRFQVEGYSVEQLTALLLTLESAG
jgi:predicted XRE-type DNA-binding protein